ncbi:MULTISPECIES: nuclear transport factor 2 family protein [Enterobacter]|uniref:nuclear transport factor 2 family protein n=2 Tax=Enterobacteriaceae TaxID=543 RepID=UPI0028CC9A77|nr:MULTISPECIES: nuclear transport factor 2 family protein [Enterobacter]MDT8100494.1 nuclear transport factor 2 family protein [Enterobacter hormaechei]
MRTNTMLLDTLKRLECSLHGSRRKDRKWLEQVLHEGFSEITRSGVLVDRAQTIEALSGEDSVPAILSSDFRLISVEDNFAILHYRTINPDGNRASLRSSCWVLSENGQWKLVFHQGTPEAESV